MAYTAACTADIPCDNPCNLLCIVSCIYSSCSRSFVFQFSVVVSSSNFYSVLP